LSVSLAAALHGILVFAALTMVMGASVPRPVIGISLLSDLGSGPGPAVEPSLGQRLPCDVAPAPVVRSVEPVAPAKVDRKPVRSKTAIKKKVEPIAQAARRIEPAQRVKTEAVSAPPVVDEVAALDSPGRDPDAGNGKAGSGNPVRPFGTGGRASGPTGVAGGSGNEAEGPVGATFGDADGPRFVQRVMPRYPELARRRGREGLVLLRLVIGPGGELRDVQVVEGGGHGFDEAALAAVRTSLYAPAMRGGRGVECAALLPIRFALKGS